MKKIQTQIILALITLFSGSIHAAQAEIVAKDTLVLDLPNVTLEQERDNGQLNNALTFIGLGSDGKEWKSQIWFIADDIYGEWQDNDFLNWDGSLGSGCYNYIRPAKSDLGFYPYEQSLVAHISQDEKGGTVIEVNGLIKNWGTWRRVLIHALIPAVEPKDTITTDLGHAYVLYNNFYQYYLIEGSNDDYSLRFGLQTDSLRDGTYHMAELLIPEFQSTAGDTIPVKDATLEISHQDNIHLYALSLLSEDNILYEIAFDDHIADTLTTDTVAITCYHSTLTDFTLLYGYYQLYGESSDYRVAINITQEAIENEYVILSTEHFDLSQTVVYNNQTDSLIHIVNAHASIVLEDKDVTMYASLTGMDTRLYEVTIPIGRSSLPVTEDTVYMDFGHHVGRVDYSAPIGYFGVVLSEPEEYDVHATFYAGGDLSGDFSIEHFDYESTYITTYPKDTNLVRFTDIRMATAHLDSIGDTLHIQLTMIGIDNVTYIAEAYLLPKRWLHGQDVNVDYQNGKVSMVGLSIGEAGGYSAYMIQLQRADYWTLDSEPGGNSEFFSFFFVTDKESSIEGEYGYSAGNLSPEYYHTIMEDSTEIYLGPMAGTLSIKALNSQQIPLADGSVYHTHWYEIKAEFLANNGEIYTLSGKNVLLCIDTEGDMVEIAEGDLAIEDTSTIRRPTKRITGGELIIERAGHRYNALGIRR